MSRKDFLGVAAKMPRLKHCVGEEFDGMRSEVMSWLVSQPAVRQLVFDTARYARAIVFDRATGEWRGRRWDA